MAAGSTLGPVGRLLDLAEVLGASWAARARLATSVGQERAILRMFGVSGLDRSGRPLAGEVVDRFVGNQSDRLAGGVALPFAAGLVEYDISPADLALDVASGAVDLAIEAEVLQDAGRRSMAESIAGRLAAAALERADANRTARLELLDVLGDVDPPWVGAALAGSSIGSGSREAAELVAAGVDVIRVDVPAIRELADRLHAEGVDVPFWRPRLPAGSPPPPPEPTETSPSGSQRGLADLRQSIDAAAAERRSYARLATTTLPLAAPEQAVVAAFERVDIVVADPVAEIVDGGVDPDRAMADHAFARRFLARAGATLLVGPGPLIVAPDLARGEPSDAATRAGRALALQLVGVAMAVGDGIPADRLVVGALPAWLVEERDPTAIAIAQIAVRRALLPDYAFAFEAPDPDARAAVRWRAILSAVLPIAGATAVITRTSTGRVSAELVGATQSIVMTSAEVARSLGPLELRGPALELARATISVAIATLERLSSDGWPSILGEPLPGEGQARLGAGAVVERTEGFDPFATAASAAR